MACPPHPGEVLRGYMGLVDVTAFAAKVGVNRVSMSRLLNGQNGISPQMALSLADILGTTPEMWLMLQMEYDLWHAREDRREAAKLQPIKKQVGEWVKSVQFKSETRPGRRIRVTRYPSEVITNKRDMRQERTPEPSLFEKLSTPGESAPRV